MLSLKDVPSLFNLIQLNKIHLEKWFEWAHHVNSPQDVEIFIEESSKRYVKNRSFDAGVWIDDTLIGVVGFHEINWNHKEVEIGYWIDREQEGKGYTRRAISTLIKYAFFEYKLNRVQIKCSVENLRSKGLAKRLGFSLEGIEREGLCFQGKFYDVSCYSLLSRDFRPELTEDMVVIGPVSIKHEPCFAEA
jgi:ribosomal-protein-serine acetyltransferase